MMTANTASLLIQDVFLSVALCIFVSELACQVEEITRMSQSKLVKFI